MSTAPLRPPRGAALAVLAALAAAGCARKGAAPETGPAHAAQAPAPPGAPPSASGSTVPPGARGPAAAAASSGQPSPATAVPMAAAPAATDAPAAPELTLEQMQRRSPSAALVETFNAACAEPRRNAVARAARRLEFTPLTAEARREAPGAGAALPEDADAWRGPEEVGGAVLVWDAATSTCELRASGVTLLLVESAFSRLPQALEDEGASVMRLEAPAAPAGGVRTRQVLLVQPGRFSGPERARVLRLGHHLGARAAASETEAGGDRVTLSSRSISVPLR